VWGTLQHVGRVTARLHECKGMGSEAKCEVYKYKHEVLIIVRVQCACRLLNQVYMCGEEGTE
jgi:hypothetical protein